MLQGGEMMREFTVQFICHLSRRQEHDSPIWESGPGNTPHLERSLNLETHHTQGCLTLNSGRQTSASRAATDSGKGWAVSVALRVNAEALGGRYDSMHGRKRFASNRIVLGHHPLTVKRTACNRRPKQSEAREAGEYCTRRRAA